MRDHNFASDCVTRAHSAQNLTLNYRLLQYLRKLFSNNFLSQQYLSMKMFCYLGFENNRFDKKKTKLTTFKI